MLKFERRSIFAGLASVLAITALMLFPTADVHGSGGSGCEGDVKYDNGGGTYHAPAGRTIESVCIKAGRGIFTFYAGETDKDG